MNSNLAFYDADQDLKNDPFKSGVSPSQVSPGVSGLGFEGDSDELLLGGGGVATRRNLISALFAPLTLSENVIRAFEQQMRDHNVEVESTIRELYRHYILVNSATLESYLKSHRALPSLLIDVASNLRTVFGDDPGLLKLEVISAEGESPMLRVAVTWHDSLASGEEALQKFDDNYWLANCRRANGNIVVDYELV